MALFAVIGLLPFAALPFKIGFTPTFLDVALLAIYFVWIMRVATRRDRELIGTPLGVAGAAFLLLAVFAFANGLRYSRPTSTTIRNFAELALAIALLLCAGEQRCAAEADLDLRGAAGDAGRRRGRGHRRDLLRDPRSVDDPHPGCAGPLQLSGRRGRAALHRG